MAQRPLTILILLAPFMNRRVAAQLLRGAPPTPEEVSVKNKEALRLADFSASEFIAHIAVRASLPPTTAAHRSRPRPQRTNTYREDATWELLSAARFRPRGAKGAGGSDAINWSLNVRLEIPDRARGSAFDGVMRSAAGCRVHDVHVVQYPSRALTVVTNRQVYVERTLVLRFLVPRYRHRRYCYSLAARPSGTSCPTPARKRAKATTCPGPSPRAGRRTSPRRR